MTDIKMPRTIKGLDELALANGWKTQIRITDGPPAVIALRMQHAGRLKAMYVAWWQSAVKGKLAWRFHGGSTAGMKYLGTVADAETFIVGPDPEGGW